MQQHLGKSLYSLFSLGLWLLSGAAGAQTIWTGPNLTFEKPGFSDHTLSKYQDRLTDNVWLTRGRSAGMFNIATESNFIAGTSPADTQWATSLVGDNADHTISAVNWEALEFTDWATAYSASGALQQNITALPAVVHLISDDIYFDIQFTHYANSAAGSPFTYERSTPVPEPATLSLLVAATLCWSGGRVRSRVPGMLRRTILENHIP